MRTSTTTMVATLLAGGLLAGCGGSGSNDFCDEAQSLNDTSFSQIAESDDLGAVADQFGQLADAAPGEIEDSARVLQDSLQEFVTTLEEAGVDGASLQDLSGGGEITEEQTAALTEAVSALASEEVETASNELETYLDEECDIQLGS